MEEKDIWEKMYEMAKNEYHPEEISPFFAAHHVVAYENRDMEIMADYESRKTVLLKDLVPNWWGDDRLKNNLAK